MFLEEYHGISISYRTLLRKLASWGLRRRNQPAQLNDVWQAIRLELAGPGLFVASPIWLPSKSHPATLCL